VEDAPGGETTQPVYHGAIRYIPSAEEINFGIWQEAAEFMRHFVPLEKVDSEAK